MHLEELPSKFDGFKKEMLQFLTLNDARNESDQDTNYTDQIYKIMLNF
jgi:hypothetical protein